MTTTRRTAIALGAVGGASALTACGGDSSQDEDGSAPDGPITVAVADVPEGGGLVQDRVVVTQPTAGEFEAFDATCPHQGCAVTRVTTEAIVCPCHGSEFALADGAVTKGPATDDLTALTATVEGDVVTVS